MRESYRRIRRRQRNRRIVKRSIALSSAFICLIVSVKLLQSDPEPVTAAEHLITETKIAETTEKVVTDASFAVSESIIKSSTNNEGRDEDEDVCNDSYITELLVSSGPGYNRLIDTIDDTVIEYTNEIGTRYGIDPCLLQSIIFYESSNRQDVSNGTCVGLMQVCTKWHTERAESLNVDLYDSYGNVLTGTDYLAELYDEYENITTALMVYHGESDALIKAENGQTSTYVNNIMNLYLKLKNLQVGYENQ